MIFKYKAFNQNKEIINGLVEAAGDEAAAEILREKNLSVISIEEESKGNVIKGLSFLDRIKIKDIVIFSRQFSVMISANVTMIQALKILVEQTENPKLKIIISEIADEVDAGARLSEVLAKRPKVFSNFYVNVIRAGETSGRLDESLSYLADEMEKDYDMMSKIKGGLFILPGNVESPLNYPSNTYHTFAE